MASQDLQSAVERFYQALGELLNKNPQPMLDLWSHQDDVSYMGPIGGILLGWDSIQASWLMQSETITKGSVIAKDLHFYESGDLGISVGIEDSHAMVDGKPQNIRLRATNIFRKEKGHFKMVAHHTDLF